MGSVELEKGQSLTTRSGRAEILLTPGVFLRANDDSSVRMVSPSLAPTVVELAKGQAIVEVTYIRKENDIRVNQGDASIKLLKKGLYDFDVDSSQVRVFKGEASVSVWNRKINLMQKEEVTLNSDVKPKARYFKTAQYEDDFYDWCRLRSENVLEANAALADQYGANYGPNWYWDPWFNAWAFPFDWGWEFYSPFPFYGYGYGAPFYGYGRPFGPGRPIVPGRPIGPEHPVAPGHFGSGGFHGGGGLGGIHGGGFGGFHGGGGFGGGDRR